MAEPMHVLKWQKNRRPFDMRALLQLAIWGVTAAACLTLVVLAAFSDGGSQRLMTAVAATQDARIQTPNIEQLAARLADTENATRRLADAVQALGADRERLLTRIASLEHALDDVTGSIKRQTAAVPSAPPAPLPAAAAAPVPASPPQETSNLSGAAALPSPPAASSQELAATSRLAGLPTHDDVPEVAKAKPEFGIDIGSAASFDGLRALWNSTKSANAAQFEGLRPVVVARENRSTRATELRLVAGPVGNADAAVRLCAALAGPRRACQPAPFEGRQLSLVAPPVERPRPVPTRKPAPNAVRSLFSQ
jgi:hypothetical protein